MFEFRRSPRRRARAVVDKYIEKLVHGKVSLEDVAACHASRLVFEDDSERRLRSLQTLAAMEHPVGVGALVKDLLRESKRWPGAGDSEILLLRTLARYCVGVRREEGSEEVSS
jgi:hypothetical protein